MSEVKELLAEFPSTVLALLSLQGVGPKTVATLYKELGIRTIDDLERAAAERQECDRDLVADGFFAFAFGRVPP